MAEGVHMEVEGVAELMAALDGFKAAAQRRITRPAVTAASVVVLRAIRQRAPTKKAGRTGQLRKSLGRVVRTYKATGVVMAVIGPRKGFISVDEAGRKVNPVKYAHLVEYGTAPHMVRGALHPGGRAKPFMRPGWHESEGKAKSVLYARIAVEIEKEGQRQAKRTAQKAAR